MLEEWHYANNGKQLGPISASDLKALAASGKLLPSDMLWKEGMAAWKPASSIQGLLPAAPKAGPPPLQAAAPIPPAPPKTGLFQDKLVLVGCALGVSLLLSFVLTEGRIVPPLQVLTLGLFITFGYFAYRRFTATAIDHLYTSGVPSLPFSSPWTQSERTAPNKTETGLKLAAAGVGVVMFCVMLAATGPEEMMFALWLTVLGLSLLLFGTVRRMTLYAKWLPAEGKGWLQFTHSGSIDKEDGTSAIYRFLPNHHFFDVWRGEELIDSYKLLRLTHSELELQHRDSSTVKYKRSMTAAEALVANPLSLLEDTPKDKFDRRLGLLRKKWEPVLGEGPAIQFTDDHGSEDAGAFIRFDGFAARYSLSKEAPYDTITVHYGDDTSTLKILSLGPDEMVLTGEGGSVHYKRGVSISAAEARKRMDAYNQKWKAIGKATLTTVGVIGAGIAILGVAAVAGAGSGSRGSSAERSGSKVCWKCSHYFDARRATCSHCGEVNR